MDAVFGLRDFPSDYGLSCLCIAFVGGHQGTRLAGWLFSFFSAGRLRLLPEGPSMGDEVIHWRLVMYVEGNMAFVGSRDEKGKVEVLALQARAMNTCSVCSK